MLKSLDVLIGISLVMLIVSMVVTVLTQFVTTAINSHGRNLKKGLQDLIAHLDPALNDKAVSALIAEAVLKHPLIGGKPFMPFFDTKLGTIIHRDELTKILMELASSSSWVDIGDAAEVLRSALGYTEPEEVDGVLDNIRSISLTLEESYPELASSVRSDMAILQEAKTKFVGKINGWFDQTIDRVSERFTTSARAITFVCALLIALGIQLDAIHLLNTLWTSDAMRQELVADAAAIEKQNPPPSAGQIQLNQESLQYLDNMALDGLIQIPWAESKGKSPETPFSTKLPGILLSAFLLSLGAPFWYNSLKTLLRMRSAIADKDDAQRVARQSNGVLGPPPPGGTPTTSTAMRSQNPSVP